MYRIDWGEEEHSVRNSHVSLDSGHIAESWFPYVKASIPFTESVRIQKVRFESAQKQKEAKQGFLILTDLFL